MAKLTDSTFAREGIGNESLLAFIDEVNAMRARSGNRYRFEPHMDKDRAVLTMREHLGIPRPNRADTPSPRFHGAPRLAPVR